MLRIFISYTAQANGNANCGWREFAEWTQAKSDELINEFIDDHWYRMQFYDRGVLSIVVKATDDPFSPLILNIAGL